MEAITEADAFLPDFHLEDIRFHFVHLDWCQFLIYLHYTTGKRFLQSITPPTGNASRQTNDRRMSSDWHPFSLREHPRHIAGHPDSAQPRATPPDGRVIVTAAFSVSIRTFSIRTSSIVFRAQQRAGTQLVRWLRPLKPLPRRRTIVQNLTGDAAASQAQVSCRVTDDR